jgi:hypothetical protein
MTANVTRAAFHARGAFALSPRTAVIKPLFNPGPSPNVRVILAVLMALGLLVADHRQHHLELLRTALSLVTYPLQLAADRPSQLFREARERLAGQDVLRDENSELHRENLLLKARLQQFEPWRPRTRVCAICSVPRSTSASGC